MPARGPFLPVKPLASGLAALLAALKTLSPDLGATLAVGGKQGIGIQ